MLHIVLMHPFTPILPVITGANVAADGVTASMRIVAIVILRLALIDVVAVFPIDVELESLVAGA